jgi:hypothetical protein
MVCRLAGEGHCSRMADESHLPCTAICISIFENLQRQLLINLYHHQFIIYLFFAQQLRKKDSNQGFDELSLSLGSKTQPKTVPK